MAVTFKKRKSSEWLGNGFGFAGAEWLVLVGGQVVGLLRKENSGWAVRKFDGERIGDRLSPLWQSSYRDVRSWVIEFLEATASTGESK